jgi:hypothetical protein
MKLTVLSILSLLLCLLAFKTVTAGERWELEFDKDGIQVYTQMEEPSPFKQVKVTTTIDAPVEKVMEILMSFSQYSTWMNHVHESYLLNQTDNAFYVFILEEATWPMQNRYQVSKLDVRQSLMNAEVHFKSVPNYIEKRTDAIQIRQFEGYWSLEDRPDHQCTLEYVLIHNPGGYVPPWLANYHAVENPFQSVYNLKQLAETARIRP